MNTSIKVDDSQDNLLARLANVTKLYDMDIYGADCKQTPFPLEALLAIYYKSVTKETYWAERVNGFKLLSKWLAPITYASKGTLNLAPIVIFSPHELGEMEYYVGAGISEHDIVECTIERFNIIPK